MKFPVLEIGLVWFFLFWLYKSIGFLYVISENARKDISSDSSETSLPSIQEDNFRCPNKMKSTVQDFESGGESMTEESQKAVTAAKNPKTSKNLNFVLNFNGGNEAVRRKKKFIPARKMGRKFGENTEINILLTEIQNGLLAAQGDKIKALDHVLTFLEKENKVPKLEEHKFYLEFFKTSFLSAHKIFPCFKKISGKKLKLRELWEVFDPNTAFLSQRNVTTQFNEFLDYYYIAADHYMNFLIDGNNITELKFDQVFQFWQLLYAYYWPAMFQPFESSGMMPKYGDDALKFVKVWKQSENRSECRPFANFFQKGIQISRSKIKNSVVNESHTTFDVLIEALAEWNSLKENEKILLDVKSKTDFLVSEKMFRLSNAAWLFLAENWGFQEHHVDINVVEGLLEIILEKTMDVSLSRQKTKDFLEEIKNFLEKKEPVSKPVKIDRLDWMIIFQLAVDHLIRTYE